MAEDKSFPASARSRLVLAVALAGLAGCADSIGFLEFGQLFMSFMSGNTTRFGVAVSNANWPAATRVSLVIALFCFGAFAGTLIAAWVGRWRLPVLLGLQGVLMAGSFFLPVGTVELPFRAFPIVFALGMQNAALQDEAGRSLALTYVTGAVVRFGTGLANFVLHKPAASFWIQLPLWAALSGGAIVGALLQEHLGLEAFFVPAGLATLLALVTLAIAVLRPHSSMILGTAPAPDAAANAPLVTRHGRAIADAGPRPH